MVLPLLSVSAAVLACVSTAAATKSYQIEDSYDSTNFFDKFNFYVSNYSTGDPFDVDPTHGFVNYRDRKDAEALGLIKTEKGEMRLGVGTEEKSRDGKGRDSVRIESKALYTHGLFIADFSHFPKPVCGSWPAFWMFGTPWPTVGEFDIYEGWNTAPDNTITLHADKASAVGSCKLLKSSDFEVKTENCDNYFQSPPSQYLSQGCAAKDDGGLWGNPLGGVYAMEWSSSNITVWQWSHLSLPADVRDGHPNPRLWGRPAFHVSGDSCDLDRVISRQKLVLNIGLCGDAAGNPDIWAGQGCGAKAQTCLDFVGNNGSAFKDVYWKVKSIKVYKHKEDAAITTTTSATTTATTTTTTTATTKTTTTTSKTATSSSSESTSQSSTTSTATTSNTSSTTKTSSANTSTPTDGTSTSTATSTNTSATSAETSTSTGKTATATSTASPTSTDATSTETSATSTDSTATETSTTETSATSRTTTDATSGATSTCTDGTATATTSTTTGSKTTTDAATSDVSSSTTTSTSTSSSSTASPSLTVSTVSTTRTYTVTSCGSGVASCPGGGYVTSTVETYVTTCPITATSPSVSPVTSTITTTKTYTITSCQPTVTNCPIGQVTSRVEVYTTVCPADSVPTPPPTCKGPNCSGSNNTSSPPPPPPTCNGPSCIDGSTTVPVPPPTKPTPPPSLPYKDGEGGGNSPPPGPCSSCGPQQPPLVMKPSVSLGHINGTAPLPQPTQPVITAAGASSLGGCALTTVGFAVAGVLVSLL